MFDELMRAVPEKHIFWPKLNIYSTRPSEYVWVIRVIIAFTGYLYSTKPIGIIHVCFTLPLQTIK